VGLARARELPRLFCCVFNHVVKSLLLSRPAGNEELKRLKAQREAAEREAERRARAEIEVCMPRARVCAYLHVCVGSRRGGWSVCECRTRTRSSHTNSVQSVTRLTAPLRQARDATLVAEAERAAAALRERAQHTARFQTMQAMDTIERSKVRSIGEDCCHAVASSASTTTPGAAAHLLHKRPDLSAFCPLCTLRKSHQN
jgi:hypothetical protein